MARQIVLYGRGGVGVTTIASNISAALAADGLRVVQVGCDPRHNSCGSLHTVMNIPTVMARLRSGRTPNLDELVITGYLGIQCLELGNPCDRREGTSAAIAGPLEALQQLDIIRRLAPDVIIYDVPWESGCTRAASPFRTSLTAQVFAVISADFMSLAAANSILGNLVGPTDGSLRAGLIANGLTSQFEESFVNDYARKIGTKLAAALPRSLVVRQSELYGKTVIEAAPLSNQASALRRLARQVATTDLTGPVAPLAPALLKRWAREWGDLLFEMENGLISDGAAI